MIYFFQDLNTWLLWIKLHICTSTEQQRNNLILLVITNYYMYFSFVIGLANYNQETLQ